MCFTSVINPWHSEDKASLRFQQTLQNLDISETLPNQTMLHSKFRHIISEENSEGELKSYWVFFTKTGSKEWTTSWIDCINSASWGSLLRTDSSIDAAVFDKAGIDNTKMQIKFESKVVHHGDVDHFKGRDSIVLFWFDRKWSTLRYRAQRKWKRRWYQHIAC
jgi:hypothetical protein